MKNFDPDEAERAKQKRTANELVVDEALNMALSPSMSEEQVIAAKQALDHAQALLAEMCSNIRGQIEEVEERRAADDNYAVDPLWWRRVNHASRYKSWQRQKLQNKIGEANRLMRAFRPRVAVAAETERRRSRDRLFVQIAQLHLSPAQFRRLWTLVEDAEKAQEESA